MRTYRGFYSNSTGSRHGARDSSESEVRRLHFRSKVFSIGDIEHSDARRVPGAAAQDAFAGCLVVIAIIVIDVRMLAVVSAVGRLGPLSYVAGHVICTVTIGRVL